AERDVRAGRHPVAAGLAPDRVEADVVVAGAPEQHVAVTLEISLAQRDEAEPRERRLVHPPAGLQVADPDADVVDDLAHALLAWSRRKTTPPPAPFLAIVSCGSISSTRGTLAQERRGRWCRRARRRSAR